MDDYTVEFVNALANQPISLITVDTSGLTAYASTINIVETQVGISDNPTVPATNVITFGSNIESGNFTLQHPDFLYALGLGDTVNMSVNSVALNLDSVTTGVDGVDGIQAVYRIYVANGPPDSNYLSLSYQGTTSESLTIKWDNTDSLFFGGEYSNAQAALDAHFGAGVWTINGRPMDMVLEFFGPATTFGSSPWTIYQDGWQGTGHPVTGRFDDGFDGIPQQYTLAFDGIPSSGSLRLNYNGYIFFIPYDGLNVNLNGHIYSDLATAVAAIDLSYGDFGPWVVRGTPALGNNWDGNLVFYGRQQSTGANPWSIVLNGWNVNVSESWTEGTAPSAGTQAQHSFYIEGAFGGTFSINGFSGIPWNIDRSTLLTYWNNNVAALHDISGYGTVSQPWIITYLNRQPQDLPTIDVTTLVGFTDAYLASVINCDSFFTISGVNPYTLTSIPNGSGQTAIVATNVNMAASMSISQPVTLTAGSAGTGGVYAVYRLVIDSVPSSGYMTLGYNGNIFPINIGSDNNDDLSESIQTRLNNIGLGGWTYGGSPASQNMTFTFNAQQSFGSNPWSVTNGWGGIEILEYWTAGAYPTGIATAVQTWVSPEQQGATGGTFSITGDATTVDSLAYNISLGDLSAAWFTATGHYISFSTGFGSIGAPFEFHFAENLAITLPTIYGALLTTDGTVSNDFTDGSTTAGQDEIQTVTLADSPTGGTWSISYNNDDTVSPLNYNIAEQDLQAALRSNWGVGTINVSKSGFVYTIDFGVHAPQFGTDTIQADGTGLTQPVVASVDRIQSGQILQ